MALPLIIDSLESVAEGFRGEYTERDGKFHLNVDGLEDTSGLKSALQKERGTVGSLTKQVKAFSNLGKSAEELAEMIAANETREREAAEKAGDHQKILQQHQSKWEAEKTTLKSELDAAQASERAAIVGERVQGALAKVGATEEGIELLPDRLSNRIKYETVDGKRVLKITQADGETPMAGSGADGTATIDDLVKEAITKYPSLFKASNAGGGGKQPNNSDAGGSGKNGVPKSWAECKTEDEKVAFLQAKQQKKG